MTVFDHRSVRTVLTPWVIAIVALFGLNALVPDQSHARESDSSDGIGLMKLADYAQTPGRITNPLVFLAPPPSGGTCSVGLASLFLRIETRRDQPVFHFCEGANRGRAPPAV